jgi:hypothetical protein
MKRHWLVIRLAAAAVTLCLVSGCGGYARSSNTSGVQVYGTVDAGISHESR